MKNLKKLKITNVALAANWKVEVLKLVKLKLKYK